MRRGHPAVHHYKLEAKFNSKRMKVNILDSAEPGHGLREKEDYLNGADPLRDPKPAYRVFVTIGVAILWRPVPHTGLTTRIRRVSRSIRCEVPRTGVTS